MPPPSVYRSPAPPPARHLKPAPAHRPDTRHDQTRTHSTSVQLDTKALETASHVSVSSQLRTKNQPTTWTEGARDPASRSERSGLEARSSTVATKAVVCSLTRQSPGLSRKMVLDGRSNVLQLLSLCFCFALLWELQRDGQSSLASSPGFGWVGRDSEFE